MVIHMIGMLTLVKIMVTPGIYVYDSNARNAIIDLGGRGQDWGQPQYSSYVLHILILMKRKKEPK